MNVAVVGGGVSGLTAAFLLSRRLPLARISLYEASSTRWGGWIDSTRHTVDRGHGTVAFEKGPRTIRPKGLAGAMTLSVIDQLNLTSSLVAVDKAHASAQNRFIYYPESVVRVPSSVASAIKSLAHPLFRPLPLALLRDLVAPPSRRLAADGDDESVDSFVRRRFGGHVADSVVSAVLHGIYAADPRDLSVRSTLPFLWNAERDSRSVLLDSLLPTWLTFSNVKSRRSEMEMLEMQRARALLNGLDVDKWSVWSLKGGMQTFIEAMSRELSALSNVDMLRGQQVLSIDHVNQDTFKVHSTSSSRSHTHVLSALAPSSLAPLLPTTQSTSEIAQLLCHNASTSVAVVNLAFPPPFKLPMNGFGYLIPKSIPQHLNPHHVLGIVFDSDTIVGLDSGSGTNHVKVSVMIGGPYWKSLTKRSQLPNHEELIRGAVDTLQRHLFQSDTRGDIFVPSASQVTIQWKCIPTYAPGHATRLRDLHEHLRRQFQGRLAVVGSGYGGVGVNDCVRSSWEWVDQLVEHGQSTGLERFVK